MSNSLRIATLLGLMLSSIASADDAQVLKTAKEIQWSDVTTPTGARAATLWSDATFVRWPYSTKMPRVTRTQDVHIVVLAGTVTFDIDGRHKEIGPGGFASIPRGVAHVLGCESSGECTFLMHLGGDK